MEGLVESLLRYPTVIFTGLMLVVSAFWLLSLIGGLDFELFDVPDMDLDVDGLDGADGAEAGGGSVFQALGLSGVPVTIAFTLVIVFGWLTSLLISETLDEVIEDVLPAGWSPAVVGVIALVIGVILAGFCVRPIAKALGSHKAVRKHELVGRSVRITTRHVTATSGQGEIDDGQAGIVAQVRCDHANGLTLHSRAIVVGFDAAQDAFEVEPDALDGAAEDAG